MTWQAAKARQVLLQSVPRHKLAVNYSTYLNVWSDSDTGRLLQTLKDVEWFTANLSLGINWIIPCLAVKVNNKANCIEWLICGVCLIVTAFAMDNGGIVMANSNVLRGVFPDNVHSNSKAAVAWTYAHSKLCHSKIHAGSKVGGRDQLEGILRRSLHKRAALDPTVRRLCLLRHTVLQAIHCHCIMTGLLLQAMKKLLTETLLLLYVVPTTCQDFFMPLLICSCLIFL